MVANHRKKFLNRFVDNLIKKRVLVARPVRDGKNYFKKIYLNPEVFERWGVGQPGGTKVRLRLPPRGGEAESGLQLSRAPSSRADLPDQSSILPLISAPSVAEGMSRRLSKRKGPEKSLEGLVDSIYLNLDNFLPQGKGRAREPALLPHPIILERIVQTIAANCSGRVTELLKAHGLLDLQTYLSTPGIALTSELEQLDPAKRCFLVEKFLSFLLTKRYEIFKGRGPEGGEARAERKLQTEIRFRRIVFILNRLAEHKLIFFRDLINQVLTDLEAAKPFKVDKKTLVRILEDLEFVGLLKLKKFQVNFEEVEEGEEALPDELEDRVGASNLLITKIFVLDQGHEYAEDLMLRSTPMTRPYYNKGTAVGSDPAPERASPADELVFTAEDDPEAKLARLKRLLKLKGAFERFETRRALKNLLSQLTNRNVQLFCESSLSLLLPTKPALIPIIAELMDQLSDKPCLETGLGQNGFFKALDPANASLNQLFSTNLSFGEARIGLAKSAATELEQLLKKLATLLRHGTFVDIEMLRARIKCHLVLRELFRILLEKKYVELAQVDREVLVRLK